MVAAVRDLGATPYGRRRIVPILGGTVRGPRLEAEILPGGADWQHVRSDGVVELVARYSIRTGEGVEIAVVNRGLRWAAPDVMEKMARGEPVDPGLVYCRTTPQFEAPAGPYDWLNRSLFIARVDRMPAKVRIDVFEVK
jgi:hypothetical protein